MKIKGQNQTFWGYFFALPVLLFIGVFMIYPLLQAFVLSLYQADLFRTTFVGFDNYVAIFQDRLFILAIRNTFYFVLLIVPATVIGALVFAVLMQDFSQRSKSLFRLLFYFPVVTTAVVLSMIWRWMYNPNFGIVSYISDVLGIGPIDVIGSQFSALLAVSFVVIIWMIGQPLILYLSAIDGVPQDLYEAAEIDGASKLQSFLKITIPMVVHATLLIVVTTTISVFQIFVVIHLISGGGPYHGTDSLVYAIYNTAFVSLSFGKSAAQSVVLFGIVVVVALIQFRLLRSRLD